MVIKSFRGTSLVGADAERRLIRASIRPGPWARP